MLGLFSPPRRKAPSPRKDSFRPTLEKLESRDCPSPIIYLTASGVTPSSKQVMLTGQVTNTSSPGGLTVNLSGVVGGTTTTDSHGNFSATLTASGQGSANAATADGQSNIATSAVTDPGTTMTGFMGGTATSRIWTFSGGITNGYRGEVVNFSGLPSVQGKSTTVYIDPLSGSPVFSYTVQLTASDWGDIYAQAIDAWGVLSNQQSYWVSPS